jgi:hypothetical protein
VNQIKNISMRIGEHLYKRISQHIQYLKHLNKSQNKQSWIENAILRKLKKEEEEDVSESLSPEKHLSFKISSLINARIEKRVEVEKQLRKSFSKKMWILEAINEQLDLEEEGTEIKTKKLFKNLLKKTSEASEKSVK